jgi:hypothetical protein
MAYYRVVYKYDGHTYESISLSSTKETCKKMYEDAGYEVVKMTEYDSLFTPT